MQLPVKQLVDQTNAGFIKAFSYSPSLVVQAPGRVNLLGEHTDYNDGFVLPCAINYHTIIAGRPRTDDQINVVALDYDNQTDVYDLSKPIEPHPEYDWANYVRGVVQLLQARGLPIRGTDLAVCGNIPQGAGVSSSAALEVAVGQIFKALYQLPLSQQDLALIGQQAENEFVGCQCGIMDQLIVAKGEADHALLIDCRSLETSAVAIPNNLAVLIINSNVKRRLVDGEYNVRREQCEAASRAFGVHALRDVSLAQFERQVMELNPIVARRAKHVITENERTQLAYQALARNDLAAMGKLMRDSHASMRDDFEITVEPIDYLADLVNEVLGDEGGARMTGGGFGGCVVALAPEHRVDDVREAVTKHYRVQTGYVEDIYVCHASNGAGVA